MQGPCDGAAAARRRAGGRGRGRGGRAPRQVSAHLQRRGALHRAPRGAQRTFPSIYSSAPCPVERNSQPGTHLSPHWVGCHLCCTDPSAAHSVTDGSQVCAVKQETEQKRRDRINDGAPWNIPAKSCPHSHSVDGHRTHVHASALALNTLVARLRHVLLTNTYYCPFRAQGLRMCLLQVLQP